MTASKKPISRKARASNRRNAQKSTGPRTEAGKRKVSRNAMTHGLDAVSHPVMPYEDEREFDAFSEAMVRDLQPAGIAQRQIVQQIILLNWKLRRVPAVEAAMHAHLLGVIKAEEQQEKEDGELPADYQLPEIDAAMLVAASFYREEKCQERLEVYQMRIQRGLHASYRQLEKLREQTAGEEMCRIYQNGCELASFVRLVDQNVAAKRADVEDTAAIEQPSASADQINNPDDRPPSSPETRHPKPETRCIAPDYQNPINQNLGNKAAADIDWPKSRPDQDKPAPAADFKCGSPRITGSSFQR